MIIIIIGWITAILLIIVAAIWLRMNGQNREFLEANVRYLRENDPEIRNVPSYRMTATDAESDLWENEDDRLKAYVALTVGIIILIVLTLHALF